MSLSVTFKSLAPREEVRRRAVALYGKLERFLDPSAEGTMVIAFEHGQIISDIVVNARHATFKATSEDPDLRTSIDRLMHTLEEQLRRAKGKRTERQRPELQDEAFVREAADGDD